MDKGLDTIHCKYSTFEKFAEVGTQDMLLGMIRLNGPPLGLNHLESLGELEETVP